MSFARLVEIHGHAVFLFIIEWTVSTWWWNKQCYVSIYQMHTYSEIFYFLRSLISWNYNFVRDTILTVHSSSGNRCTIAIVWSLLNIIWSFPSKMNDNNTSKFFSIFTNHKHVDSPTIFFLGAHTSIKLSWYLSGRQWYSNLSRVVQFWLTKWHCFLLLLLIHSVVFFGHLFTTVMVGIDSRQPSHDWIVNAINLFDCFCMCFFLVF